MKILPRQVCKMHDRSRDLKKKKIYFLELGGTISTLTNSPISGKYGPPNVHIDQLVSELEPIDMEITCTKVDHKMSQNLTTEDLFQFIEVIGRVVAGDADGIVVTAGTNALEDIAYLSGLLINTEKPIVFTQLKEVAQAR
jgi:L-asparaginase